MSRIGKSPVSIPEGVTVSVKDGVVTVKGKLGELTQEFSDIDIKVEENEVVLERPSEKKLDHLLNTYTVFTLFTFCERLRHTFFKDLL